MIRDLEFPEDARKEHDNLLDGLCYDAAIAAFGASCRNVPLPDEEPKCGLIFRLGKPEHDIAVRREVPGIISRFVLISMLCRLDSYMQRMLLQRLVIEELGPTDRKMDPETFWKLLAKARKDAGNGLVALATEKIVKSPGAELSKRKEWLEDMVRVRNCLVHRFGIVQMEDVRAWGGSIRDTSDTDRLRAKWLTCEVWVDGKRIEKVPHPMGKTQEFRLVESERSWGIGDVIHLTPDDCQAMALSLSVLVSEMHNEFEKEIRDILPK